MTRHQRHLALTRQTNAAYWADMARRYRLDLQEAQRRGHAGLSEMLHGQALAAQEYSALEAQAARLLLLGTDD